MVVLDRLHRLGTQSLVQLREQIAFKLDPALRRNLAGVTSLLVALSLAWLAHLAAERGVHETWIKRSRPSDKLMDRAFSSAGLNRVIEAKTRHPVLRSAPAQLDEPGAVWITADAAWIIAFSEQPEVFGFPEARVPVRGEWSRLGLGWPAFELALERVAKRPPPLKAPAAKAQRKKTPRDPLELIY